MKKKGNSKKNKLVLLLILVAFFMSVGYAALSRELTINGTGRILNDFDVVFVETSMDVEENGAESIEFTFDNDHELTVLAHFFLAGDSIEYTFDIENLSTLFGAELEALTINGIALDTYNANPANLITWEIANIDIDDVIAAGGTVTVTLTGTLDAAKIAARVAGGLSALPGTVTNDPDDTYEEEFTIKFNFVPEN